ncbi:MAG: L-threonylcarbamoyladenylate synthase [Verrucomicrobiales bacterium]
MRTQILDSAAEKNIQEAAKTLQAGELVGIPTETVYGLAANGLSASAVAKIFQAKQRPLADPLILHIKDLVMLADLIDSEALAKQSSPLISIAEHYWPGPLTLLLPRRAAVPDLVTAGLPDVAIRCSAHPTMRRILERLDFPLAAPSANRFGGVSPTSAAHVRQDLGGLIPLILDSGNTKHGIESTIIRWKDGQIQILRPGPVTTEMLQQHGHQVTSALPDQKVLAPGMLRSHYAPAKPLALDPKKINVAPEHLGLLAFGEQRQQAGYIANLSQNGDLVEAATRLYACLRELDAHPDVHEILAAPLPEQGLGVAIMDRLRRAAAPKA